MWSVFLFHLLYDRLTFLHERIKRIPESKRQGHPDIKLYVAVVGAMARVRQNPTEKIYQLGNTLTKSHRDWRRIKEGLPPRYRLFFKFFSTHKEIYFVWLNNETTLRQAGAKTDCYNVFLRLLHSETVPSDREALHIKSTPTAT